MDGPITLGITTAGRVAAAIVAGDREYAVETPLQALDGTLACVEAVLRSAGIGIEAVERIAVCTGPGSFTGLRIGVTFAKSLAQARDLPIVGISAYDVAEPPANALQYPHASIVEGKRSFYYARMRKSRDAAYEFARGDHREIEMATASAQRAWLPDVKPDEQALRIARRGRDAPSAEADWRGLAVDYGQRPNAVTNWEARHGIRERGGAESAANLKQE
jgi:tRNA threonylcarbamoyl adenosine modification protein YeaZ